VPLVIAISGLDSRKEDLSENFGAILPYGIGFIGLDSPGTGQSPIKASENRGTRILSRDRLLANQAEWTGRESPWTAQSFGAFGRRTRDPGTRA